MFYADSIGLDHVRRRLTEFAAAAADPSLQPAPLLARLADSGQGFASLAAK
jgi:3-hydroxyacyl-CoA dehydrogenase